MDLYNNKDMEKFIVDVFNYFNGRVNTFQKARLFINWCNMMNTPNGGITTNPNCVTIYPNVIYIPQGTDLSWMTEKEFDKWVDQVKETSWGGVNQSGINS